MPRIYASLLACSTLLLAPLSAAWAAPETYIPDPNHTNITWQAGHFGFSKPSGKFTRATGIVVLDEADPQAGSFNLTIDITSLVTGLEAFDTHLLSPDFFDAERYPAALFTSERVEVLTPATAKVHGMLTLLGQTRPVTLDVTLNKIGPNPKTQDKTAGFSATTTLKRSDFGMNYALPDISDEVDLAIEIELVHTPDAGTVTP